MSISTDSKYLGHEFKSYSSLLWQIGGLDLAGVRAAIDQHDAGIFAQSSTLEVLASRWAPIFKALGQRVDPPLGIQRRVTGGDRGAARRAKEGFAEIMYEQGEPLFGDVFRPHATMGFSWFQATWVATSDAREVRPLLTPWPAAATWVDPSTGEFRAFTQDGFEPMIEGTGKWFKVGNGQAPWLWGAIRALGTQWAGGIQTERNELSLTDYLGRKVPIAIMPDKVAVKDPVGAEICEATRDIGKARSGAAFPHGTEVSTLDNIDAGAATLLANVLERRGKYVAGALLGTSGPDEGTVYVSPIFGKIATAVVRRDVTAGGRAFSQLGDAYGALNFGLSPSESPGYEWLLPDPAEAERRAAVADGYTKAATILALEKANGIPPTQARIERVYSDLGVSAPTLPPPNPPAEKSSPTTSTAAS